MQKMSVDFMHPEIQKAKQRIIELVHENNYTHDDIKKMLSEVDSMMNDAKFDKDKLEVSDWLDKMIDQKILDAQIGSYLKGVMIHYDRVDIYDKLTYVSFLDRITHGNLDSIFEKNE